MEREFKITDSLLASTGQRFANYIVDIIVIYILIFIIAFVSAAITALTNSNSGNIFDGVGEGAETLIFILISTCYYIIFEGIFSRSVAKFITQTVVVNEDGSKPDFIKILKRSFCRIIPFDALSYLGGRSRGWHDSIPNIYVVKKTAFEHAKNLHYSFDEIGKNEESIN